MLNEWLKPTSVGEFKSHFLRKQAWAKPGVARGQVGLCGWASVAALLATAPAEDVLVVARGRLLPQTPPRGLQELRALMDQGSGICVKHAERHDAQLATLARALGASFGNEDAHVQICVTPGGTYGFGWHYDAEDVFIVQTAGIKDYYFRRNTVDAHRPLSVPPDFRLVRAEASPLQTARLVPGDCLYIPARWWHMAQCSEHSLSMSLGVPETVVQTMYGGMPGAMTLVSRWGALGSLSPVSLDAAKPTKPALVRPQTATSGRGRPAFEAADKKEHYLQPGPHRPK